MATGSMVPLDFRQKAILDELSFWAEANSTGIDTKAKAIIDWCRENLLVDGKVGHKRVILFTEYRATHGWLHQILTAHGFGGDMLVCLHGGMDPIERDRVKAAFQAGPDVSRARILLATDAASEGIDLQNHCNFMIHVEIPWNPNVMEQRNGRIDRHGQKERYVHIWHPVGKGFDSAGALGGKVGDIHGDHEFLMRAVLKVNAIREDLGSVGPVIARQIEEAMLGKRLSIDTSGAEAAASKSRKFLGVERKLQERISRLHERILQARSEFHLSSGNIARAVAVALEMAEKPPLKKIASSDTGSDLFEVPFFTGSWAKVSSGLEHPHTGIRRPITFDHDIAIGRDDVVLAHLNHRLVQMCLRLLREEIWKLDDVKKLHRVAFLEVSDSSIRGPVLLVWSRLVITGGNRYRLHEELTLSGGYLEHSGFRRIDKLGTLESLLANANPFEPSHEVFDIVKDRYDRHKEQIRKAVIDRSRERLTYLGNTIERRKQSEIADSVSVLDELERGIRKEISNGYLPEQMTIPGLEIPELQQMKADMAALQARLSRIPEERELEERAIADRYSDPIDRTFPVASIIIVPKTIAGRR